MRSVPVLLAMLLVVVLAACVTEADGDIEATGTALAVTATPTTCAWNPHGLVRTADGAKIGGASVALERWTNGAWTQVRSADLSTGDWGFSISCVAGDYQVRLMAAPAGYRLVSEASTIWSLPADGTAPAFDFVVETGNPVATLEPAATATPTVTPTPAWATLVPTMTTDPEERPSATPKPSETPIGNPTPTRVCRDGYIQVPYNDRLNIRGMALQRLFRLEDLPDCLDDPTIVYGLREFSTPPLSQAFSYVTGAGVALQCRAYTDGIIVIDECRPLCPVGVVSWDAAWSFPDQIYEEGQ